jgi:excisionase family DNA binding protein
MNPGGVQGRIPYVLRTVHKKDNLIGTELLESPRQANGVCALKQPSATPSEVMTPAQVALYLQVHKLTVYRYVRDRQLPAVRLGRSLRILKADVDEFLRLHRVGGRSRGTTRKVLGRRHADRSTSQTPGSVIRGSYQEPSVWSPMKSPSRREDLLPWHLWDWGIMGTTLGAFG